MSKPKKKYLVKVYGRGNGCALLNTYEFDKLKEARAHRNALNRYYNGYFNIVIDSVPLDED